MRSIRAPREADFLSISEQIMVSILLFSGVPVGVQSVLSQILNAPPIGRWFVNSMPGTHHTGMQWR